MKNNPDDICARPQITEQGGTRPHSAPLYLASVYECRDPEQALSDGPNSWPLAEMASLLSQLVAIDRAVKAD